MQDLVETIAASYNQQPDSPAHACAVSTYNW